MCYVLFQSSWEVAQSSYVRVMSEYRDIFCINAL